MGRSSSRRTRVRSGPPAPGRSVPARSVKRDARAGRSRPWALLGGGPLVAAIAVVVGVAVLSGQSSGAATPASDARGTVVQAKGGHSTNITPDTLASMMKTKDVTLLNVKTPYIGEIAGTDLYIPYTDLTARAAELPPDRNAPIVDDLAAILALERVGPVLAVGHS